MMQKRDGAALRLRRRQWRAQWLWLCACVALAVCLIAFEINDLKLLRFGGAAHAESAERGAPLLQSRLALLEEKLNTKEQRVEGKAMVETDKIIIGLEEQVKEDVVTDVDLTWTKHAAQKNISAPGKKPHVAHFLTMLDVQDLEIIALINLAHEIKQNLIDKSGI